MYLLNFVKIISRPKYDEKQHKSYLEILGRMEGVCLEYYGPYIPSQNNSNIVYQLRRISTYRNSRKHGTVILLDISGKVYRTQIYNDGECIQTIFNNGHYDTGFSLLYKTINS